MVTEKSVVTAAVMDAVVRANAGMSDQQIADDLGITYQAAKRRLQRARVLGVHVAKRVYGGSDVLSEIKEVDEELTKEDCLFIQKQCDRYLARVGAQILTW